MRRATWLATILMGVVVALGASTMAQTSTSDPAYVAGYSSGYGFGQQDQAAGASANPHKFRTYQDATLGYTPDYGTPSAYRSAFQSGFNDGYGDGFAGRTRTVTAPALAPAGENSGAPPPPEPPDMPNARPAPDAATTARANGYREGYNTGQSDANTHAAYNATASAAYQSAQIGYDPALGAVDDYQQAFQAGFATGYDDGYNHRLYKSTMGMHLVAAPPAAGANILAIPSGTVIHTTLNNALGTKMSYVGQAFTLTVTVPVWVGAVAVVPAGSTIQGTVEKVERGGVFSGHAQMQLRYDTLTLPGQTAVALNATTRGTGAASQSVNPDEGTVNGQNANTGTHAAKDATVGAVLGGIFGGTGGLIRGATAGAAVGTAGVLMSHDRDLTLRVGEPIAIALQAPVSVPNS